MGIMDTLRQSLAKLVMRTSGDQAKTECRNIHLCTGLEDGMEGAAHTVEKRRRERTEMGREEESGDKAEYKEEDETREGGVMVDTGGTEEEAAQKLETALEMEAETVKE